MNLTHLIGSENKEMGGGEMGDGYPEAHQQELIKAKDETI